MSNHITALVTPDIASVVDLSWLSPLPPARHQSPTKLNRVDAIMSFFSPDLAQRPISVTSPVSSPLSRPRKRPRRAHSFFRFTDLTVDLQIRILDQLPLRALYNARLAGLPTRGARPGVRNAYLRRVQQIELLRPMVSCKGKGKAKSKSKRLAPLDFSELAKITLALPNHGVLPDAICELHLLRILNLQLAEDAAHSELSNALAKCTNLHTLIMTNHGFTRLPRVVTKLWRLEVLDISNCTGLERIPPYFGKKVPELITIDITGCIQIKKLPPSLLKTLNRNTGKGRWPKQPLKCTPEAFPRGYLTTIIVKAKFPKLAAACEQILRVNQEQGILVQPENIIVDAHIPLLPDAEN